MIANMSNLNLLPLDDCPKRYVALQEDPSFIPKRRTWIWMSFIYPLNSKTKHYNLLSSFVTYIWLLSPWSLLRACVLRAAGFPRRYIIRASSMRTYMDNIITSLRGITFRVTAYEPGELLLLIIFLEIWHMVLQLWSSCASIYHIFVFQWRKSS